MIHSTTLNIESKMIDRHYGVVTGEAILRANIFRDLFASVRDIVGGRSAADKKELRRVREIAFEEISQQESKRRPVRLVRATTTGTEGARRWRPYRRDYATASPH